MSRASVKAPSRKPARKAAGKKTDKTAPATPPKKRGRPRLPRETWRYAKAGKRPKDPIKAVAWAQGLLLVAMESIVEDERMSEVNRRAELRSTGRIVAALTPYSELDDALGRVQRAHDDLDEDDDPEVKRVRRKTRPLRAD